MTTMTDHDQKPTFWQKFRQFWRDYWEHDTRPWGADGKGFFAPAPPRPTTTLDRRDLPYDAMGAWPQDGGPRP